MIFNLNEIQLKNLSEFLQRTSLKGCEVPGFLEIINIFSTKWEEETTEKKED